MSRKIAYETCMPNTKWWRKRYIKARVAEIDVVAGDIITTFLTYRRAIITHKTSYDKQYFDFLKELKDRNMYTDVLRVSSYNRKEPTEAHPDTGLLP